MINIKECNESLVDIKKFCPNIKIDLGGRRMKIEKTAYLRKTVAEMILRAEKELPRGHVLYYWRRMETSICPRGDYKVVYETFFKKISQLV